MQTRITVHKMTSIHCHHEKQYYYRFQSKVKATIMYPIRTTHSSLKSFCCFPFHSATLSSWIINGKYASFQSTRPPPAKCFVPVFPFIILHRTLPHNKWTETSRMQQQTWLLWIINAARNQFNFLWLRARSLHFIKRLSGLTCPVPLRPPLLPRPTRATGFKAHHLDFMLSARLPRHRYFRKSDDWIFCCDTAFVNCTGNGIRAQRKTTLVSYQCFINTCPHSHFHLYSRSRNRGMAAGYT